MPSGGLAGTVGQKENRKQTKLDSESGSLTKNVVSLEKQDWVHNNDCDFNTG